MAAAWRDAAPNSQLWNTYGPTECTVAVTTQLWSGEPELTEADVVTIGTPFADCQTALLVESAIVPTSTAPDECAGELLAVIAYPAQHPTELVLFIEGRAPSALDPDTLGLPNYMLPKRIVALGALPMNPHNKLDRPALQALAEPKF